MSPRDHGLGQYGKPASPPVVTETLTGTLNDNPVFCPNCDCKTVFAIEVEMAELTFPGLEGRAGTGRYLGCPACPWASPMAIVVPVPKPADQK